MLWPDSVSPFNVPDGTRASRAYIMIGGLADLGRMARHLYVESPPFDTAREGADSE
jgi:hypothetical protein